jgi:hypothetical protein
MRRNLARVRDTLTWKTLTGHKEVERLKKSAQETELNYRTRPLSEAEERTITLRFLAGVAFFCFALGSFFEILRALDMSWGILVFPPLICVFLLGVCFHWLFPKSTATVNVATGVNITLAVACILFVLMLGFGHLVEILRGMDLFFILWVFFAIASIFQALFIAVSGTLFESWNWVLRTSGVFVLCAIPLCFAEARRPYFLVFGLAFLCSLIAAHLITKQYTAYLTTNERIPWSVTQRYRGYVDALPFVSDREAPGELHSYPQNYAVLILLFLVSCRFLDYVQGTRSTWVAGPAGMLALAVLIPATWILVHRRFSFEQAARTCFQALVIFLTYNRHETSAAGVFRFPTHMLRPAKQRKRLVLVVVCLNFAALICVGVPLPPFVPPPEPDFRTPVSAVPGGESFTVSSKSEERARWLKQDMNENGPRDQEAKKRWEAELERAREDHRSLQVLLTIICIVLSPTLPLGLFFLVFTFASGGVICACYEALEAENATELPTALSDKQRQSGKYHVPNSWDNRITRIIESDNPDETSHFYLGHSLYGDYPVLLHKKLLERHAHILGSSGSNKTSIGIAPLLSQVMSQGDSSILIIDMKGDMSLFECARRESQFVGLPFKWFTNITGHSSYLFNPLDQSHLPLLSVNQKTQVSLQALSLEYGEDYGRGYFSALMESVLNAYLKRFPDIQSFRDLSRYLGDRASVHAAGLKDEDIVNSKALEVTVKRLAELNVLNLKQEDLKDPALSPVYENCINLPDLMKSPQVVYFYLSGTSEPKTVSMIGKLALFTLLTAAATTQEKERRQVYIFADEFQRLMSQNLEIFFEQARSMKLSFILANQDLSQLRGKGVDILNLVESCTAFKQLFTAADKDTSDMLTRLSGEGMFHVAAWEELIDKRINDKPDHVFDITQASDANPSNMAKVRVNENSSPRLEQNTIIEVSADQFGSFVRFAQSSGFTRFSGYVTPIICEYHLSEDEYKSRAESPWPEPTDETLLAAGEEKPQHGAEGTSGRETSGREASSRESKQTPQQSKPDTYDIDSIEARLDRE